MKKSRIFLIILAGILAVIIGILWWQFDNIKAVYYSFKYDNESIDTLIVKQNEEVDNYIREQDKFNVRPSTDSEQQLHHVGLIDDGEFVDILTGETSVDQMFGTDVTIDENKNFVNSNGDAISKEQLEAAKNENNPRPDGAEEQNPSGDDAKKKAEEKSSQCIAQMYVLKSSFTSRLEGLYNEAIAYYKAAPDSQKESAKKEIINRLYSRATALEVECDSKVNTILAELDSALTASGEDKGIITKIKDAYYQEKSLKKAYYLNLVK